MSFGESTADELVEAADNHMDMSDRAETFLL
jgi:hypothetical protein